MSSFILGNISNLFLLLKQVNDVVPCIGNDQFIVTACADGSLKLWTVETRDQAAQFLVLGQVCTLHLFQL